MSVFPHKRAGRATGRWVVEVNYDGQRLKSYANSYTDGELLEAQLRHQLKTGQVVHNKPLKVARRTVEKVGASQGCLSLREARQLVEGKGLWDKPHWEQQCLSMLRILEETAGNVALDAIDTTWIIEAKEKLVDEREILGSTVNRYWAVVGKFLKWTIDKRYRTVATLPELKYAKETKGRIRWITEAEEARLYELLPEHIGKLVGIAIRTGMRRGELLTLDATQIRPGRVNLWETKGGEGRLVPVLPEDEQTIRWLIKGNMPNADELRKAWDKARKTMRLKDDPHFVFHACRHTFATRAIENGVHIRVLQKLMGHAKVTTTERYMQVGDSMLEGALGVMFGKVRAVADDKPRPSHSTNHSTAGIRKRGDFVSLWKNGSPGLIRTGGRPINSRMLYR